mmetsp:Transcript_21803/g.65044  ORF Transcript_21803/g.65044 Transcript_21803/m.65044 type:complete len:146 (-) Transcript_21803:109-546(-)
MSLSMAHLHIQAVNDAVAFKNRAANADLDSDLNAPQLKTSWTRQVSPASTEAPADSSGGSSTISEFGEEDLPLVPEVENSDEEAFEEECMARMALSVRRLVMKDAKHVPATKQNTSQKEEDEEEENVDRLRLAARRWALRGAQGR